MARLRGGPRDLPARQQTMAYAIAWSYEPLFLRQQWVFRAFGVFVGGWTLDAADTVCWNAGAPEPNEHVLTLASLVDASLIHTELLVGSPAHFNRLELGREFAVQRIQAAGNAETCQRRDACHYARLEGSAAALCAERRYTHAARFLPAAEKLRDETHTALLPTERDADAQGRRTAQGRL